MKLIDAEGSQALNMRRLGRKLNIEAMSIYYYFKNKEDLLDGLAEIMSGEVVLLLQSDEPRNEPRDWRVRRWAHAFRSVSRAHPAAYRLLAQRPLRTDATVRAGRMFMEAIHDLGLKGEDAIVAYRSITCFIAGFVLLECAPTKPFYATRSFDGEFERGLDVILAGAEQLLRSTPPVRPRHRQLLVSQ